MKVKIKQKYAIPSACSIGCEAKCKRRLALIRYARSDQDQLRRPVVVALERGEEAADRLGIDGQPLLSKIAVWLTPAAKSRDGANAGKVERGPDIIFAAQALVEIIEKDSQHYTNKS